MFPVSFVIITAKTNYEKIYLFNACPKHGHIY